MRVSSRRSRLAGLLAGAAMACSAAPDDAPRVVSLTSQGTRAVVALGFSHLLVAVDATSRTRVANHAATTTLDAVLSHHPDLLLVPAMAPESGQRLEAIRSSGASVLEVGPHDFSDAFELYREIARALGDETRGRSTAQRIGDPLARMSARNLGKRRPLVAALISLDPPILAGGHSFVSDLIEAAGAETLTHGDEVAQVPVPGLDEIRTAAPELILIAMPTRPTEEAESFVRSWFDPVPVAFLPVDNAELWLAGSLDAAIALQDLVDGVRSKATGDRRPDAGSRADDVDDHSGARPQSRILCSSVL